MLSEENVIRYVYKDLQGLDVMQHPDAFIVASIIDKSCLWSNYGSIKKVKRRLKYGIDHSGNYRLMKFRGGFIFDDIIEVNDLIYAFNLLDKTAKANGFEKNKRIQKIN